MFCPLLDYGQLSRAREWEACKEILKISALPEPIKIDVSGYGRLMPTGITDSQKHIHDQAFLPGRNLLFLVIAGSYAHYIGARKVAIGLLSEEFHLFPDQTESFVVNANIAINEALNDNLAIVTPLINFSKNDVINLAKHYGLPLSKTYSCHSGREKYCGKCISCLEIINSIGKDLPQFGGSGE
ncbi:MAG: 7-cyano-7-deazaguanine synthase [Candidatus Bathyarchaeota archaeon]|nr:7-cyano-7-deazaguanine synthase [Candidatus Bathyarchaeota archaeon]